MSALLAAVRGSRTSSQTRRARLAFGPVMPGWGSWEWIGQDILDELAADFDARSFEWGEVPECDMLFVIKHPLPPDAWKQIPNSTRIVYCPVDHYGSAAEIDADAGWLRRCARILVHSQSLVRYFSCYAPTEYMDHHVKFIGKMAAEYRATGPLLWVGVHSNLPPLVEWVNHHELPEELCVLTNLPDNGPRPEPQQWGFDDRLNRIRIENWSPERHIELLSEARAALDIKGQDFRSRHKPPAKALDFVAAGLPLAMNADSSSVLHLARMGFDVASPDDCENWLSRDYFEDTQRFGRAVRELLSRRRIAGRYRQLVSELIQV